MMRMRIVFIHRTVLDYTVETPYRRALGGTEAGLCYLSTELAKLGHSVVLAANPSEPGRYLGVECLNCKTALTKELFDGADAVVVANEAFGRNLRELGVTKPLVLWAGHDVDQPAMKALESSRERRAWTGYAFVSQWQLDKFVDAFWLQRKRARVLRNAIAPAFGMRFPAVPWFARGDPPVLVYTSAPYRGLDVLLAAFPSIRAAIPGTGLRIFSGLSTARGGPEDQQYDQLYRLCLTTRGVEYVGTLSQPALADALADAAALAYPSSFPETSCIAAMEAMAMGAIVLTTHLGALPETLAGFGRMVTPQENRAELAREFAAMVVDTLDDIQRNPDQAFARRAAQTAFVRRNYDWQARALEWQNWLSDMIDKEP
jgi:glycosyltransferase involved in cell wall biosynthesis